MRVSIASDRLKIRCRRIRPSVSPRRGDWCRHTASTAAVVAEMSSRNNVVDDCTLVFNQHLLPWQHTPAVDDTICLPIAHASDESCPTACTRSLRERDLSWPCPRSSPVHVLTACAQVCLVASVMVVTAFVVLVLVRVLVFRLGRWFRTLCAMLL